MTGCRRPMPPMRYRCGDKVPVGHTVLCDDCQLKSSAGVPISKDIHTEHCCLLCGCKYAHVDCSVVTRARTQSFPCDDCRRKPPEPAPNDDWMLTPEEQSAGAVLSEAPSRGDYVANASKIYDEAEAMGIFKGARGIRGTVISMMIDCAMDAATSTKPTTLATDQAALDAIREVVQDIAYVDMGLATDIAHAVATALDALAAKRAAR